MLDLSTGPASQHYLVDIEPAEGERVASITAATCAEALDAYLYPFARPEVPDNLQRRRLAQGMNVARSVAHEAQTAVVEPNQTSLENR